MNKAEISYDLIMEDDMSFVEGTYRLPGQDWQVFIFTRNDVAAPVTKKGKWHSGITGIHVTYPSGEPLDQTTVEEILGTHLKIKNWEVVRGPDSMILR